jgi:putative transposase
MRRPQRVHNSNTCRHIIIRCNNREFNLTRHQRRDLMLSMPSTKPRSKFPFHLCAVRIMSSNVRYLIKPDDSV